MGVSNKESRLFNEDSMEEDDFEEDYEPEEDAYEEAPEDDEPEEPETEEYLPDPAQDADEQLDQVKKQLAASLAEESVQTEQKEETPRPESKPEDDDFEVFDLDDEL